MDREISPPPLKRRKVAAVESPQDHRDSPELESMRLKNPHCIRIFSWNVNSIQPFIPASDALITSFFKPVGQTGRREGPETQQASHGNPIRLFLQRHRWPEVVFLQELKISPSDKKTPPALLKLVNTSSGKDDIPTPANTYTLDCNLPRDKYNARGFGSKLYGVGTLIREDFAAQGVAAVRHAKWDFEGRVTIVELRPGHRDTDVATTKHIVNVGNLKDHVDRPLALLNIYAVNGTTAPYRSPETGKVCGTRHDHKLAFHTRLRDESIELESRGFSVVLAGDLNIARGRLDGHPKLRTSPQQHCVNRADFNTKFFGEEDNAQAEAYTGDGSLQGSKVKFDGVDVFRALRGKERRYTYHPRAGHDWGSSCDRVDFILVSKTLYDSSGVVETDIFDSPQERGTSDHVPLWIEIKLGA